MKEAKQNKRWNEPMDKMKKFLIYAILIAAFWLFSNILIYLAINSTYAHIDTRVYTNAPEVTVSQSAATYVNGVVRGTIRNNTENTIQNQYIRLEFYSPRDIKLGTKYIKIEELQRGASQEFEMWYRFTGVNYVHVSITDNIENATEEEFISQETAGYLIVGTLLVLYFI